MKHWMILFALFVTTPALQAAEVVAEGVASCGDLSVADCKVKALTEAKRVAAESGTAILIESETVVENFELSSDIVRSKMRAKILSFEILENNMMGETGYRYLIKAQVAPDLSGALDEAPSLQQDELIAGIPNWVLNPYVRNSIAAATCVPATGSMNMDRSMASSGARAELARIVNVRIINLEEQLESFDGATLASSFTTTSRSMSASALRGSRAMKSGYYQIDGQRQFCTLVGMREDAGRDLFEGIIREANLDPSSDEARQAYADFAQGG